jgi:asparagine synthase (glutamine-hydrolysing)
MPGIVGLITRMPREWAEPRLLQMVSALRHESFYQTGTWIDESLGIYAGWILKDLRPQEKLPYSNEKSDSLLLFSGEEFSDPGTVQNLKRLGHAFAEEGRSYLVHLSEEDSKFPASLNGRFQGLLVDKKSGTATLFNDRYGLHRIYFHESTEAFYFAAEAKAILAVCPTLRSVDSQSLGELLTCGCVLENRTLFNGVSVLPPGSAWTFRNGSIEKKNSYFQPHEWEELPNLEPEAYYQKIREVFSENLPRYFSGEDRIGLSLTGGLDSRMILAWHKSQPGALPSYSFGSTYRDCQDVLMARKVARAYGQSHQVIPVGQEFLSQFSHYAERSIYLSDGCVDVNRAADLYVNEIARKIAPVRMTGNYGGEVLRRVRAFKPGKPLPGLFSQELLPFFQRAAETYGSLINGHPLSFAVFRQAPWHHYGLLALEQTQLSVRTPYLDNDLVRTVFQAPDSACVDNDVCLRLIAEGDPNLIRIRTDRGLAGSQGKLLAALTRNYLEFTFKAEYAYDYGMPQDVAKIDHMFSAFHLERIFLGRHKFAHYRVWYRDALSSYVQEMLLDPRSLSRPYVDKKQVEMIVAAHVKGNRNYTSEIHQLLTVDLIHRLFIDGK